MRINPRASLPGSYLETDLFTRQVESIASRTQRGRALLEEKAEVDAKTAKLLAGALRTAIAETVRAYLRCIHAAA